jgi:copper chaperone CopZ
VRIQEIVIEVSGMTSATSEKSISDALMTLPGVHAVQVDFRQGRVVVTGDSGAAASDTLCAAIASAGITPGEVWFAE